MERAGYIPGLDADAVGREVLRFDHPAGAAEVAVPVLDAAQIEAVAARIRTGSAALKAMPVAEIVSVIDRAVARLLDRADPARRRAEALLPRVTGYDPEIVRLGLTDFLKTFRAHELKRFLAEDFSDPSVLDGFQPRPAAGFARALSPDLLLHVWAGNVPALPLWSLVCGLLVKAGNVGKVASAEPLMAGWFAELLVEIEPRLADALAVVWWRGGDEAPQQAWLDRAETVIAYGGNGSLQEIRARLPVTTRFLAHGHKISFGMVSRAALDPRRVGAVANAAALDVIRYDQQGCYSPQTFFVERGGKVSPAEFARYFAAELAGFAKRYPRRALSMEESAAIAKWRGAEEVQALSDDRVTLIGEAQDPWCVAFSDTAQDLAPCALDRTIRIIAVDTLDEVADRVRPLKSYLQTVGLAASPEDVHRLAGPLGAAGATRICALGSMTAPHAGWHNDGRFNLADLVTMVEIDRSADRAAERFAPYAD